MKRTAVLSLYCAFALAWPLAGVRAESRGTFYAIRLDPRDSDRIDDVGWGLGSKVSIPLVSLQERANVVAGFDAGGIESDTLEGTAFLTGVTTTQDFQRVFGGMEFGRKYEKRIRPFFGAHVVAIRQDIGTIILDTTTGQPFIVDSDTSTRFSYDLSAGLGIDIGNWSGMEFGARYLDQVRTTVPEADGSYSTTRPEYVQLYLGYTRRFDWPKGHASN